MNTKQENSQCVSSKGCERGYCLTSEKAQETQNNITGTCLNDVLTVDELSIFLKLAPKTVRQYAREKIIPAKKLGNQWRFSRLAIDQWLSEEYAVTEQKPAGVVLTSEGNGCHYSKEAKSIGSIIDTKDAEYENLLEL